MIRFPAPAVTVLLALAPACTTVRWSEVQDAPAGKLVDVGSTRGIVVADGWQPSLEEIRRFEKSVLGWFRMLDRRHDGLCGQEFRFAREQEHYLRQYRASLTPQKHRWMTVNFVDAPCGAEERRGLPPWKTGNSLDLSDGGLCQFEVEWDVDADRFVSVRPGPGGCAWARH